MFDSDIYSSRFLRFFSLLSVLLLIISCRETGSGTTSNLADVHFSPDTSDGRIFIRDYTGKDWDVTHAVEEYGFRAEDFQHGLGPYAIRPIIEPKLVSPDDPGFAKLNESERVIGTIINNEARAYPLSILRSHEIAIEKFADTHVAVGY